MSTELEPQEFEAAWWGTCVNTFGEEAKQLTYAPRMGLVNTPRDGKWPVYDMGGRSVLDIGGGPVSMLLKAVNLGEGTVVDPLPIPQWCRGRYATAGIDYVWSPAESLAWETLGGYDEVWIYNCLQHTDAAERIVRGARAAADVLRIFEWIEHPACEGHPTVLHADELNEWVGGVGEVGVVNENGANGLAWWGAFQ